MADLGIRRRRGRRRAAYLVPNLFTAVALLAGFYAIVKSLEGELVVAGWAIIFAAFMDMLDGRVARLVDAQSDFGAELDSLSDVVCFGVAPAVLAHQWGLSELGRIGFVVGFFFTAAAPVRLARFNVTQVPDPRFFRGLPSPMAGVTAAMGVLSLGVDPSLAQVYLMMLLLFFIAVTMVSDLSYYSFKDIDVRARISEPSRLLLALGLVSAVALVLLEFRARGIFLICLAYQFSGYYFFMRLMRRKYRRYGGAGGAASPAVWLWGKLRKALGLKAGL